jgi:hypothetical protein
VDVAPEDQGFVARGQAEGPHFGQLEAGVQPRPVAAEQHARRTADAHRLDEEVEAPDTGCVCVEVGESRQEANEGGLCAPVIGKRPEVRNDEIDGRVLRRKEGNTRDVSHHIVEYRDRKVAGDLANVATERRITPMDLDPAKATARDEMMEHGPEATPVADGMNKGESRQLVGVCGHKIVEFRIGAGVVGVERREDDRVADPCGGRAPRVCATRSRRIPGAGHAVALSGMTVAINDALHADHALA